MYTKKLEEDIRCPLEYGLRVFGGKWKSRIICVLADETSLRYTVLRDTLCNITDAVLAATLKELISDGLIVRKSYDEIPPHVEYSLTEKDSPSFLFYRISVNGPASSTGKRKIQV